MRPSRPAYTRGSTILGRLKNCEIGARLGRGWGEIGASFGSSAARAGSGPRGGVVRESLREREKGGGGNAHLHRDLRLEQESTFEVRDHVRVRERDVVGSVRGGERMLKLEVRQEAQVKRVQRVQQAARRVARPREPAQHDIALQQQVEQCGRSGRRSGRCSGRRM